MDARTDRKSSHERQIAEEAVRWFERLKGGDAEDEAQRHEFAHWLRHSPRNAHYLLFSTALDKALGDMDPQHRMDVSGMLAEARRDPVRFPNETAAKPDSLEHVGRGHQSRRMRWAAAAAAVVCLGVLAGWTLFEAREQPSYTTNLGEQRTLKLDDGSVLQLNTLSRVQIAFSADNRDVQLEEGEVLFKVAHETSRPFRVLVDGNVIQALGTEFTVYRKADAVTVSVLEGCVAVQGNETTVLAAGEAARVDKGAVIRTKDIDAANAASWRQRRLVFRVTPLGEVVEEFNRYNRTPQLHLDGLDGASRHYTGTFDADDPGSLALLLSQDSTLSVERTAEKIVIRGSTPRG
jgi:transmembrane sensor